MILSFPPPHPQSSASSFLECLEPWLHLTGACFLPLNFMPPNLSTNCRCRSMSVAWYSFFWDPVKPQTTFSIRPGFDPLLPDGLFVLKDAHTEFASSVEKRKQKSFFFSFSWYWKQTKPSCTPFLVGEFLLKPSVWET